MPGGVNSPVRAFRSVGRTPFFVEKAKGAYLYDADGNRYLDYVCSWGPGILGHAVPSVVEAVQKACENGLTFGAPTEKEVELAQLIQSCVPSMEMMRLVNSGTEAVMSAVRAARGFTGREKIIKFTGCYHGHSDGLLVKAGSGLLTGSVPDSAGVPAGYAAATLLAEYNDIESVRRLLEENEGQVACIVVEPVAANMGVVPPEEGFLAALREAADAYGALLIFDEVITGFRLGLGGAQGYYGVTPDHSTFGKIVGGGMPLAAYGGRRDVMSCVAPCGAVYQAGTLSGNPIAVTAGDGNAETADCPSGNLCPDRSVGGPSGGGIPGNRTYGESCGLPAFPVFYKRKGEGLPKCHDLRYRGFCQIFRMDAGKGDLCGALSV